MESVHQGVKAAFEEEIKGSLTSGKLADIVSVRGDPLADIEAMGNVNFVMKGGEVFKD